MTLTKLLIVDFKSVKILPFEGSFSKNTIIDGASTLEKSLKFKTHKTLTPLDLSGQ